VKDQASAEHQEFEEEHSASDPASVTEQSLLNQPDSTGRQWPRSDRRRPGKGAIALANFGSWFSNWISSVRRRGLRGHSIWLLSVAAAALSFVIGQGLGGFLGGGVPRSPGFSSFNFGQWEQASIIRPQLSPLPPAKETWKCEVVVIGGSLGGIAAASHSMQSGATTCLIELTPWLGGQITSQGVSALDESSVLRYEETLSKSWTDFKEAIAQQPIDLPAWTNLPPGRKAGDVNSCWVGMLCFPPQAGVKASEQLLQAALQKSPKSRWSTSTAFKGAEFDATGKEITAVYAVRRVPKNPTYKPRGRFSSEMLKWYAWDSDADFEKIPIRLQPPPGQRLMVIDATDTGELIGWAAVPYRLGSESLATTGELNASRKDNSDCTQAFTYPFILALRDDQGASLKALAKLESEYPKEEHRNDFDLQGFPMFEGRSVFNYRRIVSTVPDDPQQATPRDGDMTMINWNKGNDWTFMDPPLILTAEQLEQSKQRQNWMGGLSRVALRNGENHALLFAHWLIEQYGNERPLSYLSGDESLLGTESGLSMVPYIREGRRLVGRRAYDQREFAVREADLRLDMQGGRDFSSTAIARIHYSIDIHGCRYRSPKELEGEAASAPALEKSVRPTLIPIEALIPQGVNNLLMGGKSIAVTHIANGMTRIHQGEWHIGAAAGAIAGWIALRPQLHLTPADVARRDIMAQVRQHLTAQGLGLDWRDDTRPTPKPAASPTPVGPAKVSVYRPVAPQPSTDESEESSQEEQN
jgi:hypothetical protein